MSPARSDRGSETRELILEHLASLGSPSWYARFIAQVTTHPSFRKVVNNEAISSGSLQQTIEGMFRLVPRLPEDVRQERGDMSRCATCHGYVDEAWLTKLPPPDAAEEGMIACAYHVQPNSRLTCQLEVTPALDGLVIRLPVSQTSE